MEEESRRPEGWSCAPRSIIGNGNKQRPPTLLVTFLQPEGGCMHHLALMNCHEHLLAQKLFETSRSKQLSFRCSLPFLFLSRFENLRLRVIKRLSYALTTRFFCTFFSLFFFLSLSYLRICFLFFVLAQDWISLSLMISKNFFRSIDTQYRKRYCGYCALPVVSQDRNVSVRCATRTMHHESPCFLSVCHARTHFRERSSNLVYHPHQPFFRTMDHFFHMWDSFWRYFVSKYSEREKVRARKRRNERKTQLPRLSGISPWGNSNVTVEYTSIISFFPIRSILGFVSREKEKTWSDAFLKASNARFFNRFALFFFPCLLLFLFHCCRHEKYRYWCIGEGTGGEGWGGGEVRRCFSSAIYHACRKSESLRAPHIS